MKLGSKLLFSSLLAILTFVYSIHQAHAYTVPEYDGSVNDYAQIISQPVEDQLENKLQTESNQALGVEITVVTIQNLNGEPIEEVGQAIFDTWRIGKNNADNGILLIISVEDRQIRIQTGYGSEVFLTDASSGIIIRNTIAPLLQESKYDQAVTAGIDAILAKAHQIDQSELASPANNSQQEIINILKESPGIIIFIGAMITYVVSFLGRTKSWWFGGIIGAVIGWIISQSIGTLILAIFGLLLDYILSKNYKQWNLEHKSTSWRNTWGGFHTGGSKFKFGGGMSGGGGASGRW